MKKYFKTRKTAVFWLGTVCQFNVADHLSVGKKKLLAFEDYGIEKVFNFLSFVYYNEITAPNFFSLYQFISIIVWTS